MAPETVSLRITLQSEMRWLALIIALALLGLLAMILDAPGLGRLSPW